MQSKAILIGSNEHWGEKSLDSLPQSQSQANVFSLWKSDVWTWSLKLRLVLEIGIEFADNCRYNRENSAVSRLTQNRQGRTKNAACYILKDSFITSASARCTDINKFGSSTCRDAGTRRDASEWGMLGYSLWTMRLSSAESCFRQ
jgi:hypothetical protein